MLREPVSISTVRKGAAQAFLDAASGGGAGGSIGRVDVLQNGSRPTRFGPFLR